MKYIRQKARQGSWNIDAISTAQHSGPLERCECRLLTETQTPKVCLLHSYETVPAFYAGHSFDVVLNSCFFGYDGLRLVESRCIPERQVCIARTAVSHGSNGPYVVSENISNNRWSLYLASLACITLMIISRLDLQGLFLHGHHTYRILRQHFCVSFGMDGRWFSEVKDGS